MNCSNRQKPLKDALLSIRIPSTLKERLIAIEQQTRIPPSIMVIEALEAICTNVEETGEIRLPFRVIPERELRHLESQIKRKK